MSPPATFSMSDRMTDRRRTQALTANADWTHASGSALQGMLTG